MTTKDALGTPWYVSTAIPYVNARPHLGHALEFVLTDALARFHRLHGADVFFLTGSDENASKNVQAAEKEGISTRALVDRNAETFRSLRGPLDLSYDDFLRTSADPRHFSGVKKLWEAVRDHGDIYRKSYQGLYCVGCEQFYQPDELADGLCPIHKTRPDFVEEENYFFALSRYQQWLDDLIASDTLKIVPRTRKNEVLAFIRRGLQDFSISRSTARAKGWGIPTPDDPGQVVYVWFDALINYITALGYGDDSPTYYRYWVNNPNRTHVIGKDITRFHAVYWPAMLHAAGVLPPTTIVVHGFINVGGEKISKSLGNVVDPVAIANQYGVDALRYYLLREIRTTDDGNFTLERFHHLYSSELAGQLGNLLNRAVNMIGRYHGGVVPEPAAATPMEDPIVAVAARVGAAVDEAVARYALNDAVVAIWDAVNAANKYIDDAAPWALAKQRQSDAEAGARLATVLATVAETLRIVGVALRPFLPSTARAILAQLGLESDPTGDWATLTAWGPVAVGATVQPGPLLFPKLDVPVEA